MGSYVLNSLTAFAVGFAPFLEIYLAVPAAMALGLDVVSAVLWSALGNFLPVPFVGVLYDRISPTSRFREWLDRRISERFRRLVDRHGSWFVLVITPLIGSWAVAVTGVAVGMNRRQLVLYSAVSILAYAVLIAAAVSLGIDLTRAT